MLGSLDFILKINVDARKGLGEDSWCYAVSQNAGLVAAFDGCGGSGARKHDFYSGHSEAFVASRLCAGALFDAFFDAVEQFGTATKAKDIIELFKKYGQNSFSAYRPPIEQVSKIRSSMITTLPTTVASAVFKPCPKGLEAAAFWAGDSRVYVLSSSGLSQLSVDDSDDNDPFETDGMMTNTLNADRAFRININKQTFTVPVVLLAATDGCFAYYTTPMEFEGILLSSLLSASSAAEWERLLSEQIGMVAGDDYTLVMAVVGFGSFDRLKQSFASRYDHLRSRYLTNIESLPLSDIDNRRRLWDDYKEEYIKYIKDDSNG